MCGGFSHSFPRWYDDQRSDEGRHRPSGVRDGKRFDAGNTDARRQTSRLDELSRRHQLPSI